LLSMALFLLFSTPRVLALPREGQRPSAPAGSAWPGETYQPFPSNTMGSDAMPRSGALSTPAAETPMTASAVAQCSGRPPRIPARVGRGRELLLVGGQFGGDLWVEHTTGAQTITSGHRRQEETGHSGTAAPVPGRRCRAVGSACQPRSGRLNQCGSTTTACRVDRRGEREATVSRKPGLHGEATGAAMSSRLMPPKLGRSR